MDQTETQSILRKIEEAYEILSHPEKRNQYDKQHGLLTLDQNWQNAEKIIARPGLASVEPTVPLDFASQTEESLIAPRTDFPTHPSAHSSQSPIPKNQSEVFSVRPSAAKNAQPIFQATGFLQRRLNDRVTNEDILTEIQNESEWSGAFLKRIREYRRVTLEELSEWTRISKTYLSAIEEEKFEKLPSAVYVRGFVIQIAKVLKVPHDSVASAYMSRYYQSKPK